MARDVQFASAVDNARCGDDVGDAPYGQAVDGDCVPAHELVHRGLG